MVRTTTDADDETPAENPPTFDDVLAIVDDLEEGDKIRVRYAHKTRHTLSEPDTTTTIDAYVTVADVTRQTKHGKNRDRFRLETQANDPDGEYVGAKHRIKSGGVNKTRTNPVFVSKSTGPSVRHFQQLGRVDAIEVVDDTDTDDDVDLPEAGDKFVDTVRDRVYTVEDVGDLYDDTVLYGSDEADTFEDFAAAVDDDRLVRVGDTASETTRRVLAAKGADDTDPFAAAINEPMNDDERHAIRFVATRDDGVDFDFATGIAEWFECDQIVAEHYDVVEACHDAFAVLRDAADLRTVSTGRNGVIEVDPDTGRVDGVSLYDHAFDIAGDRTHDDVAREMLECFDVDDTDTDDDAHGCKVVADDPGPVTDGGEDVDPAEGDTVVIRTDDGVITATVDGTTIDGGVEGTFEDGARLGGTLDADEPRVHYVDYYYDDDEDEEDTPEVVTDGGEDVRPCAKCDHEGTDVEEVTETWEEEKVVSRGRRHPQTGEYMNVETETRLRGYSIPLCLSCRVEEGHDDPEAVTDGGTEVVTIYTIEGRDTTTDTDEAEAAARRGCHVTARTERRAPTR